MHHRQVMSSAHDLGATPPPRHTAARYVADDGDVEAGEATRLVVASSLAPQTPPPAVIVTKTGAAEKLAYGLGLAIAWVSRHAPAGCNQNTRQSSAFFAVARHPVGGLLLKLLAVLLGVSALVGVVYALRNRHFDSLSRSSSHHSSWWSFGTGGLTTWDKVPRFHVTLDDIAFAINTVVSEKERPQRNYEHVYKVWSSGEDIPNVYWYSSEEVTTGALHPTAGWVIPAAADGSGGAAQTRYTGPHIHKVAAAQWQERWVAMLQPLYETAPATTRWYLLLDDDTALFPDVLISVLSKYDPDEPVYLGNTSEDLEIADAIGANGLTRMGMGGGAVALSRALVAHLVGGSHAHNLAACLKRYADEFGGDKKLSLCVSDVGVPFTREPGFHQLDLKGDHAPFLEYVVSRAPVVSLHHPYVSDPPLFKTEAVSTSKLHPGLTSLQRLKAAYSSYEPSLFDALAFGYDRYLKVTAAINIGYTFRVWPRVVPASRFTKLVPAGARPWNRAPGHELDADAGSGVDYDVAPVDPPCSYGLFEWAASVDGDGDDDDNVDGGLFVRADPSLHGCLGAAAAEAAASPVWPHVQLVRARYLECGEGGDAGSFTTGDGTAERSDEGSGGGGSWIAGAAGEERPWGPSSNGPLPGGVEIVALRAASSSEIDIVRGAVGSPLWLAKNAPEHPRTFAKGGSEEESGGGSSSDQVLVAEVNVRACRSRRPVMFDYPEAF